MFPGVYIINKTNPEENIFTQPQSLFVTSGSGQMDLLAKDFFLLVIVLIFAMQNLTSWQRQFLVKVVRNNDGFVEELQWYCFTFTENAAIRRDSGHKMAGAQESINKLQ